MWPDCLVKIELLLEELRLYDPALLEKPRLIAANKMDLPDADAHLAALRRAFPQEAIFPISCTTRSGLDALKDALIEKRSLACPASVVNP